MAEAALGLLLGVVALLVVGPAVTYAATRWLGYRVSLPLLLGYVPAHGAVGSPVAACRGCAAPLGGGRGWAAWRSFPWLRVRGRCLSCGEPVDRAGLAIEAAVALGFVAAGWRFGFSWSLVPMLVFGTGLVAASAVDIASMRIPRRFVYLTAAVLGATMVVAAGAAGEPGALAGALVGAVTFLAFMFLLFAASLGRMGFGDVRLGWLIGLGVGFMAWDPDFPVLGPVNGVMQALLLGSLAGAVMGLALWLERRRWNVRFPYGPWLSLGGYVVVLLYGSPF